MKTSLQLIIPLAICCLTATAAAQDASAPVSEGLRSIAKRAGSNLVAAAEEMPAGKYGFKPTPAQMSFGDVIAHLAGGNDFLCSSLSGTAAPKRSEVKGGAPKEKLVSALRESFQFCESALAKVNDSGLSQKVPFFGNREVSRAEMMFAAAEDWADPTASLPSTSGSMGSCLLRRSTNRSSRDVDRLLERSLHRHFGWQVELGETASPVNAINADQIETRYFFSSGGDGR